LCLLVAFPLEFLDFGFDMLGTFLAALPFFVFPFAHFGWRDFWQASLSALDDDCVNFSVGANRA
jgi:hypothetical protein